MDSHELACAKCFVCTLARKRGHYFVILVNERGHFRSSFSSLEISGAVKIFGLAPEINNKQK